MVSLMIQQKQTNKTNIDLTHNQCVSRMRGLSQSKGYMDTKQTANKWDEGSQHLFVEVEERETPMRMKAHFKVNDTRPKKQTSIHHRTGIKS